MHLNVSLATEMQQLGTKPSAKPSGDLSTAAYARLKEGNGIEGLVLHSARSMINN